MRLFAAVLFGVSVSVAIVAPDLWLSWLLVSVTASMLALVLAAERDIRRAKRPYRKD